MTVMKKGDWWLICWFLVAVASIAPAYSWAMRQ